MTSQAFAILYAALATLPTAMQLALTAGFPLGRFTIGGRFPGQLPPVWRVLALVQAGLLVAMTLVVLERGAVLTSPLPDGLFWPVAGLTVLTFIANAASPSRPERMLWTPITLAMVGSVLGTGLS